MTQVRKLYYYIWVFPGGSVGKESACNAGDTGDVGSIFESARSPGGGHDNSIQFLPGESQGQRSVATVVGLQRLQLKLLSTHALLHTVVWKRTSHKCPIFDSCFLFIFQHLVINFGFYWSWKFLDEKAEITKLPLKCCAGSEYHLWTTSDMLINALCKPKKKKKVLFCLEIPCNRQC